MSPVSYLIELQLRITGKHSTTSEWSPPPRPAAPAHMPHSPQQDAEQHLAYCPAQCITWSTSLLHTVDTFGCKLQEARVGCGSCPGKSRQGHAFKAKTKTCTYYPCIYSQLHSRPFSQATGVRKRSDSEALVAAKVLPMEQNQDSVYTASMSS